MAYDAVDVALNEALNATLGNGAGSTAQNPLGALRPADQLVLMCLYEYTQDEGEKQRAAGLLSRQPDLTPERLQQAHMSTDGMFDPTGGLTPKGRMQALGILSRVEV